MADEEYEQATAEQKINISHYFISSSPTGEVHDVVIDVAKLVDDSSVLSDSKVKEIMKDYNEAQYQPAETPDGNSLVVSAYGRVSDDEYLDPSNSKVYKFDHRKHTFTEESDKKQSLDDNINSYRTEIQKSLAEYIENQYKKGKCTVTVYGADNGNITICLSARNVRLSAYWTGGWRGTYTLSVSDKGTVEMKCNCAVNVHYFEDGNVQLHAALDKVASVNVTDPAECAKAVAKAVQDFESSFQNSLEEMYVDMHRSTFKAMRRFLPITKQPMKWNQYAHHMVGSK